MSEPWAYEPSLPAQGGEVTLSGDESRHLSGARRLRAGDTLILFDGQGRTSAAQVVEVPRRGPLVVEASPPVLAAQDGAEVHLACALPKGNRLSQLLDMGTQLWVRSFRPIVCQRSVSSWNEGKRERCERILVEACKQSRRSHLPVIHAETTPVQAAEWARTQGLSSLVAHPGGAAARTGSALILLGPEGGFAGQEIEELLRAGASQVGLGEGILRIETAAVALVAKLVLP